MKTVRRLLSFSGIATLLVGVFAPVAVFAGTSPGTNGKIAYSSSTGIKIVNSDGSVSATIAGTNGNTTAPRISPDGTKVAYAQWSGAPTSTPSVIKVSNIDGTGTATQVTPTDTQLRDDPTWSPNGRWIAFATNGLLAVSASDGSSSQLGIDGSGSSSCTGSAGVAGNGDAQPSWIPTASGNIIVFARPCLSGGIFFQAIDYTTNSTTLPAPVGAPRQISNPAANGPYDYRPSYSPDGSKIIFKSFDSGNDVLKVFDATNPVPYVLNQYVLNYVGMAVFSPDGLTIAANFTPSGTAISKVGTFSATIANGTVTPTMLAGSNGAGYVDWGPTATGTGGGTTGGATGGTTTNSTTTISDDQSGTNFTVANNQILIVASTGKVGTVTIQSGGTLKGTGTTGAVTVQSGGHIAPGNSPGCLNTGAITFAAGSFYDAELAGTTACTQYDQLKVTGAVNLGGATLNTTLLNGFTPALNNQFTIVDNDTSTDPVVGTFAGLAQGGTFAVNGYTFTISYTGGDGNDVVLTVTKTDAAVAPGKPNTGLAMVAAHPLVSLSVSTIAALSLVVMARRFQPAAARR